MTKQTNDATQGESDKGDKMRQIGILPLNTEMIPSVEVLQQCGKTNIQHLLANTQAALKTDEECCQNCAGGCKVTCCETQQEITKALKRYMQSLQLALELADDDLPLLPDLRDDAWWHDTQSIAVYSVCADAPTGKWLERLTVTQPEFITMQRNGETTYEVRFRGDEQNSDTWPKTLDYAYDLHSPYLLASSEELFFAMHPDKLKLWLSLCGNLYPEFAVYDDIKELFAKKIGSLMTADAIK